MLLWQQELKIPIHPTIHRMVLILARASPLSPLGQLVSLSLCPNSLETNPMTVCSRQWRMGGSFPGHLAARSCAGTWGSKASYPDWLPRAQLCLWDPGCHPPCLRVSAGGAVLPDAPFCQHFSCASSALPRQMCPSSHSSPSRSWRKSVFL